MWLNCHRQCCKSQLGSYVIKVMSFFPSLNPVFNLMCFITQKNTKFFCWLWIALRLISHQPWKSILMTKHQNKAEMLLTVRRTFAGAFMILYVPCRFCFAWPEFWKVLFSYIFTSTSLNSFPQPGKERSSVYMLKLHLFYSQLYKSCETNYS